MFLRKHMTRLFTGDVSLLVLSGMAAQVVNLVAYPFLTQSYSPANFGAFSVITALATFSGAAILLRFDTIIQIVDHGEENEILSAALVAGLGLSFAGMALLFLFGEWLFGLVAEDQDWQAGYALILPLLALMNGLFSLSRQYFARKRLYRRFSLANILRTVAMVASQLGLVFLMPGPMGLIAGFGLGIGLALVVAWPFSATILTRVFAAPGEALRSARAEIHRYRRYIRVDVLNALIAASVLSIYPVIVIIGFGTKEAGFFAVASRLVFIPVDVLAGSISTVYFQRFSLAVRKGEGMQRLFRVTLAGATAAAAVISLVAFVIAEPFVSIFFPPEWLRVSDIMLLLLPTFAARFIIICVGNTPLALSRPRILFGWNLTQIAIIGLTWTATSNESLDLFLLVGGSGLLIAGALYLAILSLSIRQNVG